MDNKFEKLDNISLGELNIKMKDVASKIIDEENEQKELVKKGLVEIFDEYNCKYANNNLSVDLNSSVVLFSDVNLNDYDLVISGEFDSKLKLFLTIKSDDIDDVSNVSFDEFVEMLNEKSKEE